LDICGDRTLLREIKRQPWLSRIDDSGKVVCESVPAHDYLWYSADQVADQLFEKLCIEAENACRGKKKLYILLTGGLDSRVVGGILAHLYRENRIQCLPEAVCWGIPNCRDVVLSKRVAQLLGFPWTHVNLDKEDFCNNIRLMATQLGAPTSPQHLHRMNWFDTVDPDSLVIISSFGDSIGRAEYAGRHLLELDHLNPRNFYHLMPDDLYSSALEDLRADIHSIRRRVGNQPLHVECEHERQAHYMRGLATSMSVINRYCHVYQAFTSPDVFGYMWALHPSVRNDDVYKLLLRRMGHDLCDIPWSRSARSFLTNRKERITDELLPNYHEYRQWIREVFSEKYAGPDVKDWWMNTGLFRQDTLELLITNTIEKDEFSRIYGQKPYEFVAWLMSFYELGQIVQIKKRPTKPLQNTSITSGNSPMLVQQSRLSQWLRSSARSSTLMRWLNDKKRSTLKIYYRFLAKRNFPPKFDSN